MTDLASLVPKEPLDLELEPPLANLSRQASNSGKAAEEGRRRIVGLIKVGEPLVKIEDKRDVSEVCKA